MKSKSLSQCKTLQQMNKLILVSIFYLNSTRFIVKILEEIEKSEVFSEGLKEPNPNAIFVDFTPEVALTKLLALNTASTAEKFHYFARKLFISKNFLHKAFGRIVGYYW